MNNVRALSIAALIGVSLTAGAVGAPAVVADDSDHLKGPTDGLEQTIDPGEQNATGPAVLDQGHVDIGPRLINGEWKLSARDDSKVPAQWRAPADVVSHVLDEAVQKAPDAPEFAFLDAAPGQDVFVIPQTQKPGVLWLGWNTQDPEVLKIIDRGATLTLHGAQGPGHVSVFLQNGNFGPPEVLWDSDVAQPQPLWVDANTHTHANWVFTAPGIYDLDVEVSANLTTGDTTSDRQTLRFAVGTATEPKIRESAITDTSTTGSATQAASQASPSGVPNSEPSDADNSMVVLWAVGGGVLLAAAAAAGFGATRSRRAKARADADFDRIGSSNGEPR